ncbi:hypothetical protein H4219_003385 [Mycoemilia scoparia]|uniref:Uncharacterized protein n=1 Tax=Mycoemilia scoparia TaxID=417184 RepID=A0A9W8DT18_9FUNG|nr:hypothetical protein H4219_003385 [Mycoemilia scoparia]
MYQKRLFNNSMVISIPDDYEDADYFNKTENNEASFTNVETEETMTITVFTASNHWNPYRFHFEELADFNNAVPFRINSIGKIVNDELIPNLPSTAQAFYASGEQWLIDEAEGLKTHQIKRDRSDTFMVVFRVYEVHLDIVITSTVAVEDDAPHIEWNSKIKQTTPTTKSERTLLNLLKSIESFEVLDWQKIL